MENSAERELQIIEEQSQMIHQRMKKESAEPNHEEEEEEEAAETEMMSIEKVFEGKRIPPWLEQLSLRAMAVSFFLSVMFSVIVMKFNLTTGIIPSLNVAAGLLGFFFVKLWTKIIDKCGLLKRPFTRQENTVIQTCVVAAYGISFSGGFGNYLFGMSSRTANQSSNANSSENIKDPQLGWMIGFLFLVSFIGLFSLVPLRKIMIIDYKLIYPSGTATAHLINGFHTPEGAELAKKQVRTLGKFFVGSFFWGFFQWFYTGGNDCGFVNFPTLGLKAYKNRFYFDFSATYVGTGMICSHLVNISVLLGGILSWGIMWPLIRNKSGSWYPAGLPDSDLRGLQSYQVFISIAMILGDGLYNFFKVLSKTILTIVAQAQNNSIGRRLLLSDDVHPATNTTISFDDKRRTELFLKDQIPKKVALAGYVLIAAISTATIPHLFPQLKWYHVLVTYIFTPMFAFCNAYGCGLTDWSLAAIYGNLAIFVVGAWVGASHGGVLAGLAACGILMGIISTASDLMQDFKTGYLTLSSPRSMFVSQVIGTAMGCVIAPCVFWLFYKAFNDLGIQGSEYPAPFALIYRNVAILGVDGFSSLPKHCLTLCYIFFAGAILINLLRDTVGKKWAQYIPLPMAMAIPFDIGPYFAIDMCIGSLILFIWKILDKAKADSFSMAVASGLICGDGIWTLPQSVLALAQVKPPICMRFLSRQTNDKVDAFMPTLS